MCMCVVWCGVVWCVVSYTYMSDNFHVLVIPIEVLVVHAIRIINNIRLDVVL